MNYGKVKKDQPEVRNYVIRPGLKEKFDKNKVYEVIYKTLEEHLKEFQKYQPDSAINVNKNICDEIKNKLKEESFNIKRYKILVHCIIGEKKGQGMRIGSRCLWDTTSDCAVWAHYENEYVYGFVSAYGVYFY